ncbi:AAA family ATPase [Glaesserella parasuis]|uniref:AAA family ATPase n=1 Tax=Glaesserella parasuis TaxID=738 RepID=UPI00094FC385|nr:AAA family ATPase [Glaesserella parasuis]MDG6231226.1 AAA family ATPase [Glaesserella parasuis]MDG6794769.1 AAA family ATPase [Glaesserella parasuis]MDG6872027.1 AAA family ATPase [Glaesserella parasuis]MDO9984247.1 AAA family ATPase [Glaesserella parasuis]MDP0162665.1 AAA family ATPase [Glaesserella parasuis]
MNNTLHLKKFHFEQVKGVGTIEMELFPNQRVYTFIGENGIGKTKFLESLFAMLLFTNKQAMKTDFYIQHSLIPFKSATIDDISFSFNENDGFSLGNHSYAFILAMHSYPVVYLSAQHRGAINEKVYEYERGNVSKLGNKSKRQKGYLEYLLTSFNGNPQNLKNLNMDSNIEEWIVQRALSSNPYQSKEDNREIEIKTLLSLLHKIDHRIDKDFLEISGDNRVFLKIENQKREISELSSGFTSILKIIQSIIAGYSYFTNELQIANVPGIVLIDEIESHLHNKWQANIIPLLKDLFPKTIFFITTHSSIVISQLNHGEAYRLKRCEDDGVVYAELIDYPSKVSFIDLLNDAFDVNLNQLKINRAQEEGQQEAKKTLLKLVQQELANLEAK